MNRQFSTLPFHLAKMSALAALLLSPELQAATYVVDTTSTLTLSTCSAAADDCSLSGAINRANNDAAFDTIAFAIPISDLGCEPTTGVCTIAPSTSQRLISQPVLIDGFTQPGASPNTLTPAQGGLNGQIKILLDGTNTNGVGLQLESLQASVVRGLAIGRFNSRAGIQLGSPAPHRIEGCYIGTDASGTIALPNSEFGILVNGRGGAYVIGGLTPDKRNLISGNQIDGLHFQTSFQGESSNGMQILGNVFGSTADGQAALPNGNRSIVLAAGGGGAQNIRIGGPEPEARNSFVSHTDAQLYIEQSGSGGPSFTGTVVQGNLFGFNVFGVPSGDSISNIAVYGEARGITIGGIGPGLANRMTGGNQGILYDIPIAISGNEIWGHNQLGLSMSGALRFPNDVGDSDMTATGHRQQNFPEISAFSVNGSNVNLSYRVDSTINNSAYPLRVEFYKADGDEGRFFIGTDTISAAQAQMLKAISLPVPSGIVISADDVVIATASDADNHSSEFSFGPIALTIETPTRTACSHSGEFLFCDGFEGLRSIDVRVHASSNVFKPNGNVHLSDSRGASCTLTLAPTVTPLTSAGSCVLSGSGAPGSITITAEQDTFSGAFGSATGDDVIAISNFTL